MFDSVFRFTPITGIWTAEKTEISSNLLLTFKSIRIKEAIAFLCNTVIHGPLFLSRFNFTDMNIEYDLYETH